MFSHLSDKPRLELSGDGGQVWPGTSTNVTCTYNLRDLDTFQMSLVVNGEPVDSVQMNTNSGNTHMFIIEEFNQSHTGEYK